MVIKGVLFDFDGTLTEPGSLDFALIREAIHCPQGLPILEYIESLTSIEERKRARRILDEFETEAARRSRPNSGAEELVLFLRDRGLKLGIISRNSMRSIMLTLENFQQIRLADFEVVISRDESLAPKPSPDTVLAAAERMGIPVDQILVVGDFVFDIEAGRKAGAHTAFLTNRRSTSTCAASPDYTIGRLTELKEVVELFSPLPTGKLPNNLLRMFLKDLHVGDPSLLISPQVGEDICAIQIQGEEVLVLKSDPITFATDAIGRYAVTVNVNDIVTCGAVPRWFLSTLLFPPGTTAARIRQIMSELERVSREQGLILCGGHTEITEAVSRPVVAGQVVGTVARNELIDKRNMHRGDRILLTKAIGLEGTCVIARELPDRLMSLGMSHAEIEKCRSFLTDPGISILKEARIAAATGTVTAMHDVTEGGLATALEELSAAGRHKIRVYPERIPVLAETQRVCRLLELDPLGLIGSGSLLITCAHGACNNLEQSISREGIDATHIGEVLEEGEGVEARRESGEVVAWPHFNTDELARLFAGLGRIFCEALR